MPRPGTEVSRALQARNPKRVRKESERVSQPGEPQSPQRVRHGVRKEPKKSPKLRFGTQPGGIGCPARRIGDRGDREIVYVPNVYVPFPAPSSSFSTVGSLGKQTQTTACKRRQTQISGSLKRVPKRRQTRTNTSQRRQTQTNVKLKNYTPFCAPPFAAAPDWRLRITCILRSNPCDVFLSVYKAYFSIWICD